MRGMKWLVAGILVVVTVIAIMIYSEHSRQAAERDKASYDECEQTMLKYTQDDSMCDVYDSSPYHNNPRKPSDKPHVSAIDQPTSEENCKILVQTFGQAKVNAEAKKDPTLKPCVKPRK